ncbi:MAG: endonuclease domain-containing protein [Acidobacteria bacterium]|nr:endonuclease domain-containing protein [Acidobacteriota bacterium]
MTTTYHGDQARVTLLHLCRQLRRSSTDAERLLWRLLRHRQVAGAKFRRQHQYGPYILEFYCHERKLVVEADGGQHALPEGMAKDAARRRYLESRGIRTLRFTNHEILQETEAVISRIWEEVAGPHPSPHPSPLPKGEGEDLPLPLGEGRGEGGRRR